LSEDVIKTVEELLEAGRGNTAELEHILKLLKEKRPLPHFDQKYLQIMLKKITPAYRSYNSYKSEGTSLVLSLFFGLFGFMGIGHRYVGNVRRSIAILYLGWAMMIAPFVFYFGVIMAAYQQIVSQSGYMPTLPANNLEAMSRLFMTGFFFLIPVGFVIGYFVFFIWQIFDARNQTRKFNEFMDNKGIELFEVTIGKKIAFGVALILPFLTVFALTAMIIAYMIFSYLSQHSSSPI
jgi:hypothetical protein